MAATKQAKISAEDSPFFSNAVCNATATVGTETGGDTINTAIQLQGPNFQDQSGAITLYLADDEDGNVIAASAPSGGWAIGTDGLLIPIVTNKCATFVSESDGDIDITIIEATTKTFYLIAIFPDGRKEKIATIAFA